MANVCSFHLSVSGKKKAVEEFINLMKFDPAYGYSRFGLVYSFDVQDWETKKDAERPGMYVMGGEGKCPYSVKYAMRDETEFETLEMISKRLGLRIQVNSTEEDIGFEEEFLVDNGVVLVDECFDLDLPVDEALKDEGLVDPVISQAKEATCACSGKEISSVDFVKG